MKTKVTIFWLLLALTAVRPSIAAPREVIFDQGLLRWKDNREEVALFGVNYYPPHYHNYRDLKTLGVNLEQTIREDLWHFRRMRLDLLRLHVFDIEISDREGNLVDNEHLQLLDYLITQCRSNGLHLVLTPIAWWPTPNPGYGFSKHATMHRMTTDPTTWPAQRNYLRQFISHRNRYTGLTYAEDTSIAAIELINEPLYPNNVTEAQITTYINTLAEAVRASGSKKPVFYNGWQKHLKAVGDSTIEGCTFGWYPSGLVAGHVLRKNFLPNVQDYPEMRSTNLLTKAKGVYEFDAADIGGSYIYPAIARSFRAGGAQFAAQFQYDPLPVAPFNAGWQTHYLNLVYAPQKTLSFMIASEAFHVLPRLENYGKHPASQTFGPRNHARQPEFRVSHEEDLSERVSDKVFLHSNNTRTRPPMPDQLERVAGCGSSPLVEYPSTGTYFLDRLAPGQWRLEVYPDAVWVNDPFGRDSLAREVSRVLWRNWPMRITLPDLGPDFKVMPASANTTLQAQSGQITVSPGVYLLQRANLNPTQPAHFDPTFIAPPEKTNAPPAIWHEASENWLTGQDYPVRATIAAKDAQATLHYRSGLANPWQKLLLAARKPYEFHGTIPASALRAGALQYRISVATAAGAFSFPGTLPEADVERYKSIVPATLLAVTGKTVVPPMGLSHSPGYTGKSELVDLGENRFAVRLQTTGLGEHPAAAALRLHAEPPPRKEPYDTLVVRARAIQPETRAVELGLVQKDGRAFGTEVMLQTEWRDIPIELNQLHTLWQTPAGRPDYSQLSEISLITGTWLLMGTHKQPHGLEVEKIWLERRGALYKVPILSADAPVRLFAGSDPVRCHGQSSHTIRQVRGRDERAVQVAVPAFERGSAVSFAVVLEDRLQPWRAVIADRQGIRLRARAGAAATTALEFVVIEEDGTAWGCNVSLTDQWQDIHLSWDKLRYFSHWSVPANRGQKGDRLYPEKLQTLNFCFGTWLFPKTYAEKHAIEIEGVWLEGK